MSDQIPVYRPDSKNAFDLACARADAFKSALTLVERTQPYIDGEAWAVIAAVQLRAEIAALRPYIEEAPATAARITTIARTCPVFRHITGRAP